MGSVVVKNAVVRKVGYLYYVDGQGNVCEAQMKRPAKKAAVKKAPAKVVAKKAPAKAVAKKPVARKR